MYYLYFILYYLLLDVFFIKSIMQGTLRADASLTAAKGKYFERKAKHEKNNYNKRFDGGGFGIVRFPKR